MIKIWASYPAVTTRYPKTMLIPALFQDELKHAVPSGMRFAKKKFFTTIEKSHRISKFATQRSVTC